jgi:uncharacterized membrane protein YdbT with pleckstrin-like domain
MSYLDDHLLAGERVVYRARVHWSIFATAIVGIGLLLAIAPAIHYASSEFAVTDKRVVAKLGFIERESLETLLSKIEAIGVDQGIVGRMLGYGTITITGTGGTEESFPRIADPLEFRRQIQSQVVALDERRGGSQSTAGAAQPNEARVERDCPYCAERILARARVCKHCGRDVAPITG